MYKLYAKTDEKNIVIELKVDVFENPSPNDFVAVKTYDKEYDNNDHIHRCIMDMQGHYNYKVVNGELMERTDTEKAQDISPSTAQDKLNATLMLEIAKLKAGVVV